MPKDIHQVLGNLRRRIYELSRGDYSRGYINALPEIEDDLHNYHPDELKEALSPLLRQLYNIPKKAFDNVSNDPHEEINNLVSEGVEVDSIHFQNSTGESKRDLMRKEIRLYISYLEEFLKQDEKPTTIKYLFYNKPGGRQKLDNLRTELIDKDFISDIKPDDFELVFSGNSIEIKTPINWEVKENAFHHFLKGVFGHSNIVGYGPGHWVNWKTVSNCFTFHGKIVNTNKVQHNTDYPAQGGLLDDYLKFL